MSCTRQYTGARRAAPSFDNLLNETTETAPATASELSITQSARQEQTPEGHQAKLVRKEAEFLPASTKGNQYLAFAGISLFLIAVIVKIYNHD